MFRRNKIYLKDCVNWKNSCTFSEKSFLGNDDDYTFKKETQPCSRIGASESHATRWEALKKS